MKLNIGTRWLTILCVLSITVLYAIWQRSEIERTLRHPDVPILKALPSIAFQSLEKEMIETKLLQEKGLKAIYVHFWGTWCAPCEAEFPSLIKFTKATLNENVIFLLVAENDEEMKVRKFLKEKAPDLPSNVRIVLDNGQLMPEFGTVKVPETYLFNGKGVALKKYVGSFDWEDPRRIEELNTLAK